MALLRKIEQSTAGNMQVRTTDCLLNVYILRDVLRNSIQVRLLTEDLSIYIALVCLKCTLEHDVLT